MRRDQYSKIYVYSWDPTRGKINEYTGYYYPTGYGDEVLLTKIYRCHSTWFRKIPRHCGEFYGNKVWFTEPNPKKAQLIFIEAELQKIDKCKETIEKAEYNIRYLSNYWKKEEEDNGFEME